MPLGDVEIHSELNETPQPGYHGTKTTLLDREPTVGSTTGTRQSGSERSRLAEIRYEDDSGPQLFLMKQDEISVGRGGDDVQVNLALYTNDEVSREHLRVRRDPVARRLSDRRQEHERHLAERQAPDARRGRNAAPSNRKSVWPK